MTSALLIRLDPSGPWRFGPGEGGRDRVDTLFRSDRLFSAITIAFEQLGLLESWLDATARADTPAVVFSSLFPFQGDTQFVTPPATLWPPPAGAVRISSPVFATKVRWKAARFVPVSLVETLLLGQRILAEQWTADADSGCLLRRDRPQASPFRPVNRTSAAVDRLGAGTDPHSLAAVEFEPGSGLWAAVVFASDEAAQQWKEPLIGAIRLLADTGFGGRRSCGWGRAASVRTQEGLWPNLLLPKLTRSRVNGSADAFGGDTPSHWLLSLFQPGNRDEIDWKNGSYSLTVRGGLVESVNGGGAAKKRAQMIEEGSVVVSSHPPLGSVLDVRPDGFAHAVYRYGFALSIPLPSIDFAKPEEREVELAEALDEALKAAAMTEPETTPEAEPEPKPEAEAVLDIVGHAPVPQEAPATPYDEAPALSEESAVPERLSVENPPPEEESEPETNKPQSSEQEPSDSAQRGDSPTQQEDSPAQRGDSPERTDSDEV
jgi:CRISPR type III-A-associated RAMP protein Csm4